MSSTSGYDVIIKKSYQGRKKKGGRREARVPGRMKLVSLEIEGKLLSHRDRGKRRERGGGARETHSHKKKKKKAKQHQFGNPSLVPFLPALHESRFNNKKEKGEKKEFERKRESNRRWFHAHFPLYKKKNS